MDTPCLWIASTYTQWHSRLRRARLLYSKCLETVYGLFREHCGCTVAALNVEGVNRLGRYLVSGRFLGGQGFTVDFCWTPQDTLDTCSETLEVHVEVECSTHSVGGPFDMCRFGGMYGDPEWRPNGSWPFGRRWFCCPDPQHTRSWVVTRIDECLYLLCFLYIHVFAPNFFSFTTFVPDPEC